MAIVEYYGFQADSNNIPLIGCAGVYQLINQVNGKCYIGISQDVARRIRQHSDAKQRKLGNAIRKYGTLQFMVNPVAYSIDDRTDWLPVLEAQLIAEFDSVKNGYNVVEASNLVGPYGEEFAQIVREYHKAHPEIAGPRFKNWWQSMSPEDRKEFLDSREPARLAGIKAFYSDPEKSAADLARRKVLWADPEKREKQTKAIKTAWYDPQLRADQSVRLKEYLSDTVAYERRLEQLETIRQMGNDAANKVITGSIWITDGTVNRRVRPGQDLPAGFSIGRTNSGRLGRKPQRARRAFL